jgi:hypothetical protein
MARKEKVVERERQRDQHPTRRNRTPQNFMSLPHHIQKRDPVLALFSCLTFSCPTMLGQENVRQENKTGLTQTWVRSRPGCCKRCAKLPFFALMTFVVSPNILTRTQRHSFQPKAGSNLTSLA